MKRRGNDETNILSDSAECVTYQYIIGAWTPGGFFRTKVRAFERASDCTHLHNEVLFRGGFFLFNFSELSSASIFISETSQHTTPPKLILKSFCPPRISWRFSERNTTDYDVRDFFSFVFVLGWWAWTSTGLCTSNQDIGLCCCVERGTSSASSRVNELMGG